MWPWVFVVVLAALTKYVVQDPEGVSVHFHPKLR